MSYLDAIQSFNLGLWQWVAVFLAMFILGVAKSGVKGTGVIIVVIMAFAFGERLSTGILLIMLIYADVLAVSYYKRYVKWHVIKRLIPWMIIGVLIGVLVGDFISELVFKRLMAIIIIASVGLMLYIEKKVKETIPSSKLFIYGTGLLAGFTTMIGNLAGSIFNIYFLAMRFPKNEFIGTAAWLFFIINIFKLPFHIWVWETVSKETFLLSTVFIPFIVLGFFVGVKIVKRISNLNYNRFILIVTALGGVILFLR